jgi:beta-glucosidase/6-phospho-beta-glucosidase/beta-galactosidase
MNRNIMFATGVECSYPTIDGGKRRDLLQETGHYTHWRTDFQLCKEVGARYVRYGIPYHQMHLGPQRYDWSFADEVLPVMQELGLVPILDLCHFGMPDWAGNFQNDEWPDLFADFADAFAQRYPWIIYYTPVNEIMVCAKFSGQMGIWNEQLKSDAAMIKAHANMCRATLLAIERIVKHRPDAIFFQSEATEALHEQWPQTHEQVKLLNELRFLTFDFLYGHAPTGDMLAYLFDQGLKKEQYQWFMENGQKAAPSCVMGMDYYKMNERVVHPDGGQIPSGPMLGWHSIARTYYERYRRPMMLTETNVLDAEEASAWLWSIWSNVDTLRREGVPVLGLTWYSVIDQIDWDIQLREFRGKANPNGLYSLQREARPVATAFRRLTERYRDLPLLDSVPFAFIPDS